LHSECCARLTLDDLSATAGVHPVHLSRVFRRFQREGIGEYTRRLRVRASCRYLLDPELPLAKSACSPASPTKATSPRISPRHRPNAAHLPFAASTLC